MRGGVTGLAAALLVALAVPSAGAAQTALPVGEADGVRLVRERGALVVVFTPRAERLRRKVAGKRVNVACTEFFADGTRSGGNPLRAPKRGRRIRTGDLSRVDYCRLWLAARTVRRDGKRRRLGREQIVAVPLTQAGAIYLDEQVKAFTLASVLSLSEFAAEDRNRKGYLTPAELLELFRGAPPRARLAVVPLAAPSDTPPGEAIGYYGDGAQHAAVVILSASGRRLFVELDGDVLHTNVAKYIFGGLD